jgi:putative ABC transport system permease protein
VRARRSLLDRKLRRDLWHLRGQAGAVVLVVACGVASFVTARGAYDSLRSSQRAYYQAYRFAEVFAGLTRAPLSLLPRIRALPGVREVATRVVVEVTADVPGLAEPATARLVSLPEGPRPLNGVHLRRGRLPEADGEVLASESFAEANGLVPGDALSLVVNGRGQRARVSGIGLSPEYVYEIRGAAAILPDNRRFGVLWTPREALARAFQMDGAFNDVALALEPGTDASSVVPGLDRLLEPYGGLGAHGREDQVSHAFLDNELEELSAWGRLVPAIFLAVAGFLLNVVAARLVLTQREQIALLKAFGFSDRAVGLHYLKLVMAVVGLGALAGAGLGLYLSAAMTRMYADYFRFPVMTGPASPALLAMAVGVSAAAGLLGALQGVRAAVRMAPAEAMRPEAPARFRVAGLERTGAGRRLSLSTRMIVRGLGRRPLRAALSVVSIGLAVAVVVTGRYLLDAVVVILDVQLRDGVQREDATVVFTNPRGAGVRHALFRLPAVTRVEPFRAVPVRLRVGHRSQRTVLTGIEPGAELRRVMDRRRRLAPVPAEGLLVTTQLARALAVVPGDRLRVEQLDGRRLARDLPVAATVDELMGMQAYMDGAALDRAFGLGRTVSGAHLAVDADGAGELYAALKRTPAVSGVAIRTATLRSFEETIGTTFGVFTTVLVLLAAVLALGTVYNSARIALSERGRELASLRVLGFTRGEVARLLLGEQLVLTLLALPVGFALGYGLCGLISWGYRTELLRLPLVVTGPSVGFALLAALGSAAVSAVLIGGRLDRLDLVQVLKTRE